MISFMLSALQSGSGKTMVTVTLLELLRRRGLKLCSFKTGPDYIDPGFHRCVEGVDTHNLDLFMSDENTVKSIFAESCSEKDCAVIEGAMGFYDGLGGISEKASSYDVARLLRLPVIMVIDAKGLSFSVSAVLKSFAEFRRNANIVGFILNRTSLMIAERMGKAIAAETGLKYFGYIEETDSIKIESRHLGLIRASENNDLIEGIKKSADKAADTIKLSDMISSCRYEEDICYIKNVTKAADVKICVVQDRAFSFVYKESLELFEKLGADIEFVSLIDDEKLPDGCKGLYIPGGYPELYAKELSDNRTMRESVKKAIESGMPVIAECGGFMYLQDSIEENGLRYEMAGVYGGCAKRTKGLVRFGYVTMDDGNGSILNGHSFHHYDVGKEYLGCDYKVTKPMSTRSWSEAYRQNGGYAGFPHLYPAGCVSFIKGFLDSCEKTEI